MRAFAGVLILSGAAGCALEANPPAEVEPAPALHGSNPPPVRIAPSESSQLTLRLADWIGPGTPAAEVEPAPALHGSNPPPVRIAPSEPSDFALRLADRTGPQAPALADAATPALGAAAPHPLALAPAEPSPPGSVSQAPLRESPAPEPPSSRPAADRPEGSGEAPGAAPGSGVLAAASYERDPATTLTLTLGHSRRLRLDHDATAVLVASPEVADVRLLSPDVLYVIGKAVGRTSVAVLGDGARIEEWVVSIGLDLEPLHTVLAGEPGLRGVCARSLARGVALTGEVASAAAADRALRIAAVTLPEGVPVENELRVAAPLQVNLEVQIAEVHRSATEHLGINWQAVSGSGDLAFWIGRDFRGFGDELLGTTIDGVPAASVFFGNRRYQGMIDALATAGLANVLARPNVTAISGETASFFSGGEFPLPAGFEDGVIIFEYKKYGVLLDFVPTVVDSGRIVLTVRPEVSEPSRSQAIPIEGVEVPVINVRRAETTVEVGDGESIVIAGLFRNTSNTAETGVPGLKDMPLLGVLFGQTAIRSEELELIVVVTARLVRADTPPAGADTPRTATRQASGYHY